MMGIYLHEDLPAFPLLNEWLSLATTTAQKAGELAVAQFRQIDARRKEDGTLVTAADEAADRLISQHLRAHCPDHAILSEEQTTSYDPADQFTWVVDPIDGTTNFARGMIIWGVSIGLLYRRRPLLGVIHMPLLGQTYAAIAGRGATLNDEPIHSAAVEEPDDQHLLMQCTRTARSVSIASPLKSRMLGSAAYHLMQVADGSALAGLESTPKIWDIAAAAVILDEAGALLTLMDGRPIFPLANQAADYGAHPFPLAAVANSAIQAHLQSAMGRKEGT